MKKKELNVGDEVFYARILGDEKFIIATTVRAIFEHAITCYDCHSMAYAIDDKYIETRIYKTQKEAEEYYSQEE